MGRKHGYLVDGYEAILTRNDPMIKLMFKTKTDQEIRPFSHFVDAVSKNDLVLTMLVRYLDTRDLLSLGLSCKMFHDILTNYKIFVDKAIFKSFYLETSNIYNINAEYLKYIDQMATKVYKLLPNTKLRHDYALKLHRVSKNFYHRRSYIRRVIHDSDETSYFLYVLREFLKSCYRVIRLKVVKSKLLWL